MKKVVSTVVIPIKVLRNTHKGSLRDQWARIKEDKPRGRVLHTGQLPYILKVARQRYNTVVDLP